MTFIVLVGESGVIRLGLFNVRVEAVDDRIMRDQDRLWAQGLTSHADESMAYRPGVGGDGTGVQETGTLKEPEGKTKGNKKAGSPRKTRPPARAEDTRFELVRLLHQHAFQACAIDH